MNSSTQTPGRGSRFRGDPHLALRPFIVEYWGLARDLAAMGGFTVTPDCLGEILCCADDMYVVGEGRREKLPTCILIGLLDRPLRLEAPGVVHCMAARLQPWSVGRFLAHSPALASRGWQDAEDLLGPGLAVVTDLLVRGDWRSLSEIFDQMLMEQVGRWSPRGSGIEMVQQFVADGQRPTGQVAGERHVTRRQVERTVRALTGTSPKQLASLSRFQKTRDAIWADPCINLAWLAVDVGYSDQPHLTREFRRYSGRTPACFARESAAMKRWLAAWDVAFVQEPAAANG